MSTSSNGSDPGNNEDSTHIDDIPGLGEHGEEEEDTTTSTAPSPGLDEDRYIEDDLYDEELLDFGLDEMDEDVATHTAPGRPDDPRR